MPTSILIHRVSYVKDIVLPGRVATFRELVGIRYHVTNLSAKVAPENTC